YDVTARAEIPGMPGVRYTAGIDIPEFTEAAFEALRRERDYLARQGHKGPMPPAVFVAISGGGDNGAFAAGLLNAWTATGTRPEFKLVTGISTGALIAPFAFLGPKYDGTLKEVYTTISPKDVLEPRSFLAGVLSDGMADNAPLLRLTRKSVTEAFLKEIAAEYAKGRMLLVATADLDARRAIIWDMGKIASYGGPKALDLFVKVMVASASIPGGFPPMMVDVVVDGKPYQEMHVDGGIVAQVFAYPAGIRINDEAASVGVKRERKLYVIRNARLDADWAQVERSTMSIASRAVASLIQSQGIGDLYRIYATAERDGVDFNLAFIPASFKAPHKEEFDTDYMRALYDTGYNMASKGYPWAKAPPGFALPAAITK
ncbi:patatin-like phospholipase family protein, partial [Cupriavidus taiwanensis]